MKKTLAFLMALILAAGFFTACGGKGENQGLDGGKTGGQDAAPVENQKIDTLRLMFVPSHDAETILAATESLKQTLRDELAAQGYDVANIEIAVGESYEAVGEALADGTADVGVGMPGGTYVLYDDACEVILTATRDGLSKDYDDAKSWNDDELPTVTIDSQTTFYRALIIAGPSERGAALGAKVNAGEALTWAELDAATWSVMGTTSSAGYIYPSLWLQERYGKGVADLSHTVRSESYDDSFARLASGEVDVLLTYADARRGFAERWETECGRSLSIWEETNVIGVTSGIYNDTITVSKSSPIMDFNLIAALQEAFIAMANNTDAGRTVISVYNHTGYQKAAPADYDNERAAQELIRQLG